MLIRILPLIAAAAPLVAVTLAHWLSVQNGILPACIPYFDGCTSISATGRHPPGSFVFRAVHLPLTTVLAVVWFFAFMWLGGTQQKRYRKRRFTLLFSGLIAAIALVIYVTFLGTTEPIYEFMRRGGIYFYFLGTAVAQVLTSTAVNAHAKISENQALQRISLWMFGLCLLPFALGILNFMLKAILENPFSVENQIEWLASLSMQAWFVTLYFAWRETGFDVSVNGLDQRESLCTRASVNDPRKAMRSARSSGDSSKPRMNSDL